MTTPIVAHPTALSHPSGSGDTTAGSVSPLRSTVATPSPTRYDGPSDVRLCRLCRRFWFVRLVRSHEGNRSCLHTLHSMPLTCGSAVTALGGEVS